MKITETTNILSSASDNRDFKTLDISCKYICLHQLNSFRYYRLTNCWKQVLEFNQFQIMTSLYEGADLPPLLFHFYSDMPQSFDTEGKKYK